MDPPYGLKVAEWDNYPFSTEDLKKVLRNMAYVNQGTNNYHVVIFHEFQMYSSYLEAAKDCFGDKLRHSGLLWCSKIIPHPQGVDLVNAVESALYLRIGTPPTNLTANPSGTNIISAKAPIKYVRNSVGGNLNPAQKPASVIKTLVKLYSTPNSTVIDLFAGSGQVALTCAKLGRNSVSVEKDHEQVLSLQTRLAEMAIKTSPAAETNQPALVCAVCKKKIAADELETKCVQCSKHLHPTCGVHVTKGEKPFCSIICKDAFAE